MQHPNSKMYLLSVNSRKSLGSLSDKGVHIENNSLHLVVERWSGVKTIVLVLGAVSLLLSQNFHANFGKSLNLSLPLGFSVSVINCTEALHGEMY